MENFKTIVLQDKSLELARRLRKMHENSDTRDLRRIIYFQRFTWPWPEWTWHLRKWTWHLREWTWHLREPKWWKREREWQFGKLRRFRRFWSFWFLRFPFGRFIGFFFGGWYSFCLRVGCGWGWRRIGFSLTLLMVMIETVYKFEKVGKRAKVSVFQNDVNNSTLRQCFVCRVN